MANSSKPPKERTLTTAAAVAGTATTSTNTPRWHLYVGWGLSALGILGLTMSAAFKLMQSKELVEQFTTKMGFPAGTLVPIGIAEITCVILFAIPRTAVLGAVLATGYLGGAVATHVHMGDAFISPLIPAVFIWGGLFLREPRLRALLPVRR